jgi:hypothetical protein
LVSGRRSGCSDDLIGVDTGAFLFGVLSAVELPSRRIFSVREEVSASDEQGDTWGALRDHLWCTD